MPERVIGGSRFTVEPLPAMRAFVLQVRLAPALAEVLGALGGLQGSGAELSRLDVSALAPAFGRVAAKLPPAELEAITRELLGSARCDGVSLFSVDKGDRFDVVMAGRAIDTWQLLFFAVEVNYPDFFARLGASRAGLPAAASPPAQ